jgi:predicted DNA-binding antitoxin AbrB/MazE fold protein
MAPQKMVRAIYHDGILQLLEPVDLPDGIELRIPLPIREPTERAAQGPLFPTRAHSPETLCRLRGRLAIGGDALVDSEALDDARGA